MSKEPLMSKIQIIGASIWVRRMFEACGPHQWARELLKNSLEAGATKVEFGIESYRESRRGNALTQATAAWA